MNLTIQKAKAEDLETLYQIEKKCFTIEAFDINHIETLLHAPNSVTLVALAEKKIVGFIIGLILEEEKEKLGYIITLDVLPKYRRKRVGHRLLEEVERIFREKAVKNCYLEVRIDNIAALGLYAKHGYKQVAHLKNFYQKGLDGIRLKKIL
jgi:ribosomal-protein-alanine N-acetyltransferase